ncbi:MAG: effector-associated domain EAD1-containing protein [Chloroflexota bacterium]
MKLDAEMPRVFANLYSEIDSARIVVDEAGLDSRRIAFSGTLIDVWWEILREAEKQDQLAALVEVALADYPQNPDLMRIAEQARSEASNGAVVGAHDMASAAPDEGLVTEANEAIVNAANDSSAAPPEPDADADSRLVPALRNTLANLYPNEMDARRVVADAGMDGSRIVFSGKAINTWISILVEAARTNSITALLNIVREEYPGNRELAELMRLATATDIGGQLSRVQTQLLRWARNSGLLGGAEAEPAVQASEPARAEGQLAQSLRATLADLYAEPMDARRVAADAGMDLRNVTFTGPMIEIWHNLLGEAARTDRLNDLLAMAAADYPNNPVLQQAADLTTPAANRDDPSSLQQALQGWARTRAAANEPTATPPPVTPPSRQERGAPEPAVVPDAHAVALAGLALRLAEQGEVEQALALARTIGDDGIRARALTDLLPHLVPEVRQRVMREALALAYSLDAPAARSQALVELTRVLGGLYETDQALTVARSIEDPAARAQALADLVRNLSANEQARVVEETLDALEAVAEGRAHAAILANLAPYLSRDLLDRALTAAANLADDGARALALGVLAAQIYDSNEKSKWRQEALAAAQGIEESADRAATLTKLIPYLDDANNNGSKAETVDAAFSAAQSITDIATRVNALLDLALALPPTERRRIVREVRAQLNEIEDGPARAAVQAKLALCLAEQGETGNALSIVRGIEDVAIRAEAQATLAFHLVEHSQPALAISTARGIAEAETRTRTLTELVPRLAAQGALDEARAVTRDIADDNYQAQALAALVYFVPPEEQGDLLREALALVGGEIMDVAAPNQASTPNSAQDEQLPEEEQPADGTAETTSVVLGDEDPINFAPAPVSNTEADAPSTELEAMVPTAATGNAAPAPDQGGAQPGATAPVDNAEYAADTTIRTAPNCGPMPPLPRSGGCATRVPQRGPRIINWPLSMATRWVRLAMSIWPKLCPPATNSFCASTWWRQQPKGITAVAGSCAMQKDICLVHRCGW